MLYIEIIKVMDLDVLPNAQCTQFHGKWAEKDRNFGVTLMIEPVFMRATREGVKIIVVFVALVAALVLRSTVWKDNVVAGAWMMVLVGAVCGLMYYVRKRYPGKRKVGGTMDTVISALLILFCVVYVGMGAMALVAMNK